MSTMTTTAPRTATVSNAQAAVLRSAMQDGGRVASHDTHRGTLNALARRGLIRQVERFASGESVYRVTGAGRIALAAHLRG